MSETAREERSGGLTRKRFIDWLLGTSLGGFVLAVIYPVVRYWVPPVVAESAVSSVTLPFKATDVADNTGRIFKFGSKPGILIKTPSGELRAFNATCTHLSCTVQFRADIENIWCACHNGHYDLNGRNISGPPPRPLDSYNVNVRGDQIIVSVKT
ncbi:MAG: ubiquinol-cytochrome c reductase iron-sulfur subunit [Gemmatimonadetes bacterium]|nr:ubiquinol-cytochrome c reductase iron-sulfur subunit [Gemmatimonadota bacterium]